MLIKCSLIIQDLTTSLPNTQSFSSEVYTKRVGDDYYVCVDNSMFPTSENYRLTMLQNIYRKFMKEGKLGLEFSEPRQALLIVCNDKKMLYMFFRHLKSIMEGKNILISTSQLVKIPISKLSKQHLCFDPMSSWFEANGFFDNRVLNMKNLSKLVLENCDLPTIPIQIGHLAISYLSITGSRLPTTRNEQDVFWNWTSISTICNTLATLKMDTIGLTKLPLEIFFLKNLETLSACNNSLSYLPHFIGDLKKLKYLFVADNLLAYVPHILYCRTFRKIDISNNPFLLPRSLQFDHITKYIEVFEIKKKKDLKLNLKPLNHLAFYTMIDNLIPFKRQDIPRTLWMYFDVVGRCMLCNKWTLPEYSYITHIHALPLAMHIVKDLAMIGIPWQSIICRNSYYCERDLE